MKKFLLTLFVAVIWIGSFSQSNQLENLGLVSQLVEIKYTSEAYLASVLGDKNSTAEQKKEATKKYNAVRLQTDRIILQMAADMRTKNSPKLFRKLNRYYKSHKLSENSGAGNRISPYADALADLYASYLSLIPGEQKFVEAETLLGIEQGWTIIKDINEMRGQKVDGILEVLDHLRLDHLSKIGKKDDDDEGTRKSK